MKANLSRERACFLCYFIKGVAIMTFKNILCVSDLSIVSKNAEYAAMKLSALFGAKLTVLSCGEYYSHVPNNYFDESVIQPVSDISNNLNYSKHLDQKRKETIDYFNSLQKELNIDLNSLISYEIKLENEVTATLDLLDEVKLNFDLIVVGKQNNSHWERFLFGSPAKEICDETRIPTLFIPSGDEWKLWSPTGIVSCTSLTGKDENAELLGAHIATKFKSDLTIMHVIDEESQIFSGNLTHIFPIDYIPPQNTDLSINDLVFHTKKRIEEISEDIKKVLPDQEIKSQIDVGQVSETVMNYLKSNPKNNLLIIGSRGENALKRFFLGSNTDVLEEACQIPILIVFYPNISH